MSRAPEAYSGIDNLEALRAAKNYNGFLLKVLRENIPRGVVLDFGAGMGDFATEMKKAGYHVLCVEPDESLFRGLEKRGFETYKSLEEVPVLSGSLYSLNVLEHIGDDRAALEEISSKLKENGLLVLYVPAFQLLYSSMDRKVGHLRRYKKSTLKELVGVAGFGMEKMEYVDSLGFLITLLYKAVGSREGSLSPSAVKFYDRFLFPLSRAMDRLFHRAFGKNLLLIARKK